MNGHLLQQLFPGSLISRHLDFPHPSRSPDLTLCDVVLWEKEQCFISIPRSVDELRVNIEIVLQNLTVKQCNAMVIRMINHMEHVVHNGGRHVEHIVER